MSDENKELTEKIRWLLLLRVVILSFFLGATALFHFFGTEGDLSYLLSLSVPLVFTYLISIISVVILPHVPRLRLFAHAQVCFDVILITGIIRITGDIGSPFSVLYNLAVLNGAILLFYRGAFFTAGCSSLSYVGLLLWSQYYDSGNGILLSWSMLIQIFLSIGSFFVIAWLSGLLTNKLSETEQLLKEKQIDYQELDAFKDALLKGIGSGVAIADRDGRINYFNQQAQELTSLSENAVKGKRLEQIFPGLNYDFETHRNAGALVTAELPLTNARALRSVKQIRLTLAPLCSLNGDPIGFLSIFEDITRQKEIEEKVRLEEELRRAREVEWTANSSAGDTPGFHFEGVIGKSGGIENIHKLIQKVASTNTNILISGESGTGKELVARAIHLNGPRRQRPFVGVNCAAIPENLIESELFGHVRGAFTGAVSDHIGLFKQADQGTIFLDEVGELPLHLQVKLLRVLQEKSFTPVGGNKPVKVDVRIISATNRDLRKELEEGRFREDLFYRLNVVHMVMPPLRSRTEDIPALAHYFLKKFATSHAKKVEEISSGALMRLMNYVYPGNIRELENVLEHAVAVTGKNVITEDDLPQHLKGVPIVEESDLFERTTPAGAEMFFGKGLSLDVELETHEKCILLGALKRANGVQKKAAELLGINYRSLRHRLEKYDLLQSKTFEFGNQPEEQQ
ncbi:MAG TPA: sigma 54-interacting transcriptional regulator [Phototrophicaceae bacterium]|nr:sigma 54-interacting transcriptional regulator [Phototrophicaceae bacterium]